MSTSTLEDQLRWEGRARRLLQWAALESTRASSPEEMLPALLAEVCRVTGWPVGHVLRLDDDGQLASAGIWHLTDPVRFQAFREASEAIRFAPGIGLPGRVMATGEPVWITDIASDENFPRSRAAKDIGVRAAFAFPVMMRGAVVAVLEFASPEPTEPDAPLLEGMVTLGAQVGWLMERARADTALRDAEQRLRAITETANDAVITADATGRVVTWNGAAETMFGYLAADVIGQPLSRIIPDRFRAAHDAGIRRVGAGGDRHVIGRTVELSALKRDGSELPVELSLAAWSIDGSPYYTGILRDISERKRNEAALQGATDWLARSERAAVEASRLKSIFLANMSHELRTPLNAILGFVQLLGRDQGLSAEQRRSLDIILRSGEHLLGLINDVLSIAKIEAGEVALSPVDFDLPRLIRGLKDLFHLRAEAKGLRLAFELDAALPVRVHGDEGKLRQVLINLLGNAVKFTASGGVALRARWEAGRATFEIEDTGQGISVEEKARLFEPFVQAAGGARAHEGTGLGLAISRDFVRLLGGDITVASAVGEGSRFSFSVALPLGSTDEARTPRRVIGIQPTEGARHVLVVDNDDDNRLLLAQLMRVVGFTVSEARDGREAVEAWRETHPAVVWMDMRMPVMDGYEATRQIRVLEGEQPDRARSFIYALTASAFDHDRPAILAAGCDDVLSKPFREETLFRVLADQVGVSFLYEGEAASAPPAELSVARLDAVPVPIRAALQQSLIAGDDLGARRIAEELTQLDPSLGRELLRLVADFQFDQILDVLERAGTGSK